MLLFVHYLQANAFQRIHLSPNMVKYRHAYYEACNTMIDMSVHKKHLSEYYDFKRILRAPNEKEFEKEVAQNPPDKEFSKDGDFDFGDDLDDNFSEPRDFGESEKLNEKLEDPKIESQRKELTSQSQPSVIIETLTQDVF